MIPRSLHLGENWSVPLDAATESWGFLGQRGSGKSNALVVLAEELHAAGVPWVTIDPKGDHWGVRSSADGKQPGLPVPVFGGLHADVPLEPGSGKLIADLLFDNVLSAVLDISRMTVGNMSRFLIDFFHQTFDRHQADPYVRMMLLEEAHRYIPQSVSGKTAELKEAAAKIPLEGRSFGLGSATASQRSSRLHKDVLTQFSIMVAMRSPAKLDRDAIGGWVEEQEVSAELLRDLPSLKSGQAWLWSPHALERAEKVMFRRRSTFDSGATPKVGQATRKPKTIADVDLGAIKEQMAETIERAKENDPAELKRQIKDLHGQLATAEAQLAIPPVDKIEYVVPPKLISLAKSMLDASSGHVTEMSGLASELKDELGRVLSHDLAEEGTLRLQERTVHRTPERTGKGSFTGPPRSAPQTRGQKVSPRVDTSVDSLSGAPAKILQVIAQQSGRGITSRRAGFLAGYSSRKSTVRNAMSNLRQAGYIEDEGNEVFITDAGMDAVGPIEPLPTGEELKVHWFQEIGPNSAPGRILLVMLEGSPLDRIWTPMQLADATGINPGTSTLRNAMSKLRQLGLVTGNHLDPDFVEAIR